MNCILVRHGIAVEPDEWEGTEENRPLTNKGKRHIRQAAEGLAALERELNEIGRHISWSRGDYQE